MTDTHEIMVVINGLKEPGSSQGFPFLNLETSHFHWTFDIQAIDKLGLLFCHLGMKPKNLLPRSIEKQGESLKQKLSYLNEGFKLLEHDPNSQTLFLRSTTPYQKENKINYFELVLKRGEELSLDHYEFDRSSGRKQIHPANLAKDTFERILTDLEASFRQNP